MRIYAQFSDGLQRQLDGRAIGDEFTITAKARITGAEEALIEVSALGERDASFVSGDIEVKLLLSHGVADG